MDIVKIIQIIGALFEAVPEVIEVVRAWAGDVEDSGDPAYAQCKAILDRATEKLAARKAELAAKLDKGP